MKTNTTLAVLLTLLAGISFASERSPNNVKADLIVGEQVSWIGLLKFDSSCLASSKIKKEKYSAYQYVNPIIGGDFRNASKEQLINNIHKNNNLFLNNSSYDCPNRNFEGSDYCFIQIIGEVKGTKLYENIEYPLVESMPSTALRCFSKDE